jgi:hypothetical protein
MVAWEINVHVLTVTVKHLAQEIVQGRSVGMMDVEDRVDRVVTVNIVHMESVLPLVLRIVPGRSAGMMGVEDRVDRVNITRIVKMVNVLVAIYVWVIV